MAKQEFVMLANFPQECRPCDKMTWALESGAVKSVAGSVHSEDEIYHFFKDAGWFMKIDYAWVTVSHCPWCGRQLPIPTLVDENTEVEAK